MVLCGIRQARANFLNLAFPRQAAIRRRLSADRDHRGSACPPHKGPQCRDGHHARMGVRISRPLSVLQEDSFGGGFLGCPLRESKCGRAGMRNWAIPGRPNPTKRATFKAVSHERQPHAGEDLRKGVIVLGVERPDKQSRVVTGPPFTQILSNRMPLGNTKAENAVDTPLVQRRSTVRNETRLAHGTKYGPARRGAYQSGRIGEQRIVRRENVTSWESCA